MNHKRLITLQPGDAYTFSVTVANITGASLTFSDLGDDSVQQIGPGETVEVRVEAKPKPQAAAIERKTA